MSRGLWCYVIHIIPPLSKIFSFSCGTSINFTELDCCSLLGDCFFKVAVIHAHSIDDQNQSEEGTPEHARQKRQDGLEPSADGFLPLTSLEIWRHTPHLSIGEKKR